MDACASLADLSLGGPAPKDPGKEPVASSKSPAPGVVDTAGSSGDQSSRKAGSSMQADLRIQVVSDLHIEQDHKGRFPKIPVTAPVLALLGDVGNVDKKGYAAFVRSLAGSYETILLIAGNHEFYGCEYEACKADIRELAASLPNVHFLDGGSVTLAGVRVLGCTLWSHVPPAAALAVSLLINDYAQIQMQEPGQLAPHPLCVADTNALHSRDVTFLQREIAAARAEGIPVLVLTHHSPLMSGTSSPEFDGPRPTNHAFATNLSQLMGSPVAAWVYGHTHFNPDGLEVQGTRILANQKGYNSDKRKGVAFDPGLVLHVKGEMETTVERSM